MLKVTYFYREPRKTGVSIEGIFHLMKKALKDEVDITEFYCDATKSRLENIKNAKKSASEINHITGDVNFLAFGLKGKKNILTIHDLGHYDTLKNRNYLHFLIYKLFWYKYPLKYIDIITVVSEFTKQKLINYFNVPDHKIRVITNPVKPLFYYNEKNRSAQVPHILMLGSGKHKNLTGLIEAAKNLSVHIDIVGWPSPDEQKKLDYYKLSYTIYNGLTDQEVYLRYIECDILYIASFNEGFGMPIIEAQAVGRPVITSNMGAMKEVAKDTAMLVDPYNIDEIRNAIIKISQDETFYKQLVTAGLLNAEEYNYQNIAKQYLNVYQELVQSN